MPPAFAEIRALIEKQRAAFIAAGGDDDDEMLMSPNRCLGFLKAAESWLCFRNLTDA